MGRGSLWTGCTLLCNQMTLMSRSTGSIQCSVSLQRFSFPLQSAVKDSTYGALLERMKKTPCRIRFRAAGETLTKLAFGMFMTVSTVRCARLGGKNPRSVVLWDSYSLLLRVDLYHTGYLYSVSESSNTRCCRVCVCVCVWCVCVCVCVCVFVCVRVVCVFVW